MGKVAGTILKVVGIAALGVITLGATGVISGIVSAGALTGLGTAVAIGGSIALSVGSGLLAVAKAAPGQR